MEALTQQFLGVQLQCARCHNHPYDRWTQDEVQEIVAEMRRVIGDERVMIAEVYVAIEHSKGELGYYIVSDGGNVPWRARTRPNSFINYQIFPKLIEGHMISDVVAVLGSINVIAAELDR